MTAEIVDAVALVLLAFGAAEVAVRCKVASRARRLQAVKAAIAAHRGRTPTSREVSGETVRRDNLEGEAER